VGVILAAVFAAVFILGSMYVYKTHSTLAGISGVNTEVTEVGIYVRADDSADSIGATADYVYGVLTDLDRANSDKAIQEVDSETGKTVQVQEFAGLTELVDGLLNGQTGAIVLNSAYLSVIEEMDGYSDISSRIRELTVKKVETTIEPQETEAKVILDNAVMHSCHISVITDMRMGIDL
jgi:polyisoprenyl-teichoic acid--peptidoglycan teichoic acid transferase